MQTALLPHLIWKDLRHVRVVFGLWLLLLLAQGVLIGSGFSVGPGQMLWQIAYTILAMGIPVLQGLVLVILIPLLIQDESLVGTTAFWFTRPISRGTVLAAKVLFIVGLLVIPPLVVELLVFLANGIQTRDIVRALPQVLYTSLSLIVPIAALSTLTRSFARFAIWLVSVWVAVMAFGFVVQFERMIFSMETFMTDSQNTSLLFSRSIAAGLCGIVGGALVIGNQYLTRRMRTSFVILIVTVASSICVQMLWNYDFLKHPESAANTSTFRTDSVSVALNPKSVFANDALQFSPMSDPRTSISARFKFSAVPHGYQLEIADVQSELTFADGAKLPSGKVTALPGLPNQWWASALSEAIDGVPVLNGDPDFGEVFGQVFSLDTSIFQERKSESATLRGTLSLKAKYLTVVGRLPLRSGARMVDGSRHVEIATVVKQTTGCRLILRERKLNLWSTSTFSQFNPLAGDGGVYLLVNRARNQAILPDQNFNFDMASTLLQATAMLVNRSIVLDFSGSRRDKEIVSVDADWLAGAELVRVQAESAGTLKRELTADNFVLSPKK